MPDETQPLKFTDRLKLRWMLLLRSILHLWVKAQVIPDADEQTGLPPGESVCYVMADYALSSTLILDKVCQQLNLDRPLYPIQHLTPTETRAYAVLRRMNGLLVRRPSTRRSSEMLARLVSHCEENPEADIKIVPVTVLIGRAPDKADGFAKVLFTEDWQLMGRFRRLLSTFVNGRDTVVQFSRPISLRQLVDEGAGSGRSVRKVSRILRTHFRRVKTAVIGPDLSHRRTMIDAVVNSQGVKTAISDKAERAGVSTTQVTQEARDYALEIAANYSYTFVRVAFFSLNWFLKKVYGDTRVYHFETFKEHALDHEIVYVPCHRSHADYILLSFLLYIRGLAVPHIAAGINLNLPVVGSIIRKGGAFYLRRSFRSQKLYSAVFAEYVSHILSQGVPIEYFIEGTRSRTGRLLPPKGGMLAMTVRGYLRNPVRPVMFQPVYIGYEKLLEGNTYARELAGAAKKKESLFDLFKVRRLLKRQHGEAHVSFGRPVMLNDMLDERDPDWRSIADGPDEKPVWMTPMINDLGDRIMREINATADVNPVNLLATILLATPRHALDEVQLRQQIELYRSLVSHSPLGDRVTVTDKDAIDVISHGFELGLLERIEHQLGDIVRVAKDQAISLTYFRNNSAHLFAMPSVVAGCFLHRRSISREQLERVARDIFPFLRAELYLPWSVEEFPDILQRTLDQMIEEGLLHSSDDQHTLQRAEGGSLQASQVNLLACSLITTLERYYITFAVLAKNGSGTLSRGDLERLCILTAQRISMTQGFEAPDFYDRGLFKQFIQELRHNDILASSSDNKLEFGDELVRMGNDSRLFLDKAIRHSIIQVAPQAIAETNEKND